VCEDSGKRGKDECGSGAESENLSGGEPKPDQKDAWSRENKNRGFQTTTAVKMEALTCISDKGGEV